MDTLAPPPAAPPVRSPVPAELWRERSRRKRWHRPLLCLDIGLLLTLLILWKLHPSNLQVKGWGQLTLVWIIGIGATLLTALSFWLGGRRSAPLYHARLLDENLRAMNRLEAAALLESQADPIALAQREETAAFLVDHGPTRRGPNYLRLLLLAFGAVFLAHLATLTVWTRPWVRPATVPIKAAPTPPPVTPPKASIVWKTPKSEIKASPVEEVPLEAVADSASGLRGLVLEAAVNGEPRPGISVPADVLVKPGAHPIQTSLYLDQLNVQPYDMVSYFLSAKRIVKVDLPDTVSAVQFVEIKPFRDDIREIPGGDGGKGLFDLLTALKVAQLNLLKQNFVLAHAEISHDNAAWKKENARVGNEQSTLGTKADEVIAQFIQKGLPANIVDLLQQSRAQMEEAAGKIQATKNLDALPMQGKSLAFITEIEKFFIKLAAKDGSSKGGPKNVKDPFEKPKDFELKQRFETIAGGLEALAREQLKLAQELAKADPKDPNLGHPTPEPPGAEPKKPDPNRIEGTFTERQTLIAQRIGALLNGQPLPPEVNTHLASGQDHARESLRQLDAEDIVQAREPAAAAARELRLAIQTMDRLGEDNANDKLADALNKLNKAADEARDAAQAKSDAAAKQAADDAAAQAADARDKLADAAGQQQETGSAQAAARLADAARALNDPKLRDALKQWHDQPRNDTLARAAADRLARAADQVADQQNSQRSSDDIAKLVERVERTRHNFERLAAAQPGKSPGQSAPDTASQGGQPPLDGTAPVDAANSTLPTGNQLGKDAAGRPQDKGEQGPGQGDQHSKDGTPSGKEGKSKAAQSPTGKGKEGKGRNGKGKENQGKGQGAGKSKENQGQGPSPEGEGNGQGKGNEGKGQGQGEGQAQGQGQGEGQGKDQGQGRGESEGQSQAAGKGSQGQGMGEPGSPGQPPSDQPGQTNSAGGAAGRGRGTGDGSASDPSSEEQNTAGPPPGGVVKADNGKSSTARGTGAGADSQGGNGGSGRNPPYERQARELLADLRDESLEARTVLVSPDAKLVLEELHPDIHSPLPRNNISVVASFERIRAPLNRLIVLLQAELERSQRQHGLTDQTQEKAPLAYGEAVADYFEKLSRDYQSAPTPDPSASPEASVSPTP